MWKDVLRTLRPALAGFLAVQIVAAALPASAQAAEKARIADVEIEIEGRKVRVSFRLENGISENMRERIRSGLATELTFEIELIRIRKRWTNKVAESRRLQVVTMYNAVSRDYLVNYKHDGDLIESRMAREPDELDAAVTEIVRLDAFSLEGLEGDFRVRVRAVLGTGSILFFIPTTRTTEWEESRRFQIGPNGHPEEGGDGAEEQDQD